jgi:hypothetical protein
LGKKEHLNRQAQSIVMEELTAAEQSKAERRLRKAIRGHVEIEPEVFGDYLLRHVETDRAINKLKRGITHRKDFHKRKAELLELEYFAVQLTKKTLDPMAFNKKGGARITKQMAMEMIESFEKENQGKSAKSIYFDKDSLQSLLDTPGCVGVKIHYAKGKEGNNTLVLIPVDQDGLALWEDEQAKSKDDFGALNVGNPCPPYC